MEKLLRHWKDRPAGEEAIIDFQQRRFKQEGDDRASTLHNERRYPFKCAFTKR
jgi:hypothetical protein